MKPIQLALPLMFAASVVLAENGVPGSHFIENWDLDGDGAVTLAEAQERRGDVFSSFDSDEDGQLSAAEYVLFDEARANDIETAAGAQGPGMGVMMRAADGMRLQVNDSDGDGQVSRHEFITGATGWIDGMDRNRDGVVSGADFGPGN